ncbi:MAG: hypothetical protein ACI8YQ_002072 [Polaribacter sp.]|jgi:hypothetical protein
MIVILVDYQEYNTKTLLLLNTVKSKNEKF